MPSYKASYKIYTLGCKVNQYDSGAIAVKLQAAGFMMAKNNADLAIINTCAVTKTALRKGRQMINRARRENPQAKIAIVGCAVRVYKEEVDGWGGDIIILDFRFGILDLVKKIIALPFNPKSKIQNPNSKSGCFSSSFEKVNNNGKSRYFIKVQDGCRQFCSYCIIPYARGELSSRPVDEIIKEAQAVVDGGIKEIVLCGIHLGQYGVDPKIQVTRNKKQTNLVSLLKVLIEISGIERIRLSSIEVNEVTDELITFMKKNKKMCRHLHIPMQSGCDKILKLMNRPYTTKIFAEKIKKIRQAMPDTCPVKSGVAGARDSERFNGVAITTDVIVGFPGETDQDFQATVKFIKLMNFSQLHIFPFSAHEQTPAASMPNQVPESVKNARVKKLNDLSRRLEKAYAKKFTGKPLEVIIDGRNWGAKLRGRTQYNFDLEFVGDKKYRQGEVVQVRQWQLL